jgi:plasmid stabilization system protein ParE
LRICGIFGAISPRAAPTTEGLRGLPYRNRCIYYRSYHDRIVVLRVKHGAEDIKPQDFEL